MSASNEIPARFSRPKAVLGLLVLSGMAMVLAPAVAQDLAPAVAQDLDQGRTIFLAKCAKCHGENGVPRPIAKGAPTFADPEWSLTLERIERSVTEGKGEIMPRFKGKLEPAQIKSVAAFVQTLNTSAKSK